MSRDRQPLRLSVIVAQHELGHFIGHLREQRVAGFSVISPSAITIPGRILMLTSWSEVLTPAGVVDRVGVDAAACERVFDSAQLREAEVAALGGIARAGPPLAAHGVVGAVSDLGVPSPCWT